MNFCTLTCINWLRTVPYVRAGRTPTVTAGLVVIGVHTPEFSFERDPDLVREALEERTIDYPVAVDNDYEIWRAFHNRYWPALYFLDPEGTVRDRHFGEGQYEQSERTLQRLLGAPGPRVRARERAWKRRQTGTTCAQPRPTSGTDAAPAPGRVRSRIGPASINCPRVLGATTGHWDGRWTVAAESVRLDQPGRVHRVPVPGPRRAPAVPWQSATSPIPRARSTACRRADSHGVDTDEDGNGVLTDGRLYQLVRYTRRGTRTHPADHIPRAGRGGVRVHLRMTGRTGHAGVQREAPSPM